MPMKRALKRQNVIKRGKGLATARGKVSAKGAAGLAKATAAVGGLKRRKRRA